ncbi:MAG: D-alanyl-D-alanine-carboxypeptidase/endopeptidase AmpH [Janthinobacterium lividum]
MVVAFSPLAFGQNRPPLETADALVQKIFQRTASMGMVVTIVRDGEVWTNGYGRMAPGSDQVPQPNSLVRLCSVTKILATDLLAKLVVEKKVSFDDPLQKFAPAGVQLTNLTIHGPARRPINLGDLATHTAGLPREIAYPPPGAAHFTFPDYAFRWQWLPGFRLRTSPGDAAHYSNISFDLLADALGTAAAEPYAQLFQQRTSQPLSMVDTTLNPSAEQCTRLMSGPREPSMCTNTEAAAGSGGMYSTAQDMARFLKYLLYLPGVPVHQNGWSTGMYLDPADLRSVQGLGHAGVPNGIGIGWIEINKQYGESRIVEKTGGGAGFQTYIALNPARHAGIFIARTDGRNRGGANLFREANNVLLAMVDLPPVPADLDDPERERTGEEIQAARMPRGQSARGAAGLAARAVPRPGGHQRRPAAAPIAPRRPGRLQKAEPRVSTKRRPVVRSSGKRAGTHHSAKTLVMPQKHKRR